MYNTVELPTKRSVGVKPKLQWKPLEDAGNVECLLMKAPGSGCSKTREKPRGRKGVPKPAEVGSHHHASPGLDMAVQAVIF